MGSIGEDRAVPEARSAQQTGSTQIISKRYVEKFRAGFHCRLEIDDGSVGPTVTWELSPLTRPEKSLVDDPLWYLATSNFRDHRFYERDFRFEPRLKANHQPVAKTHRTRWLAWGDDHLLNFFRGHRALDDPATHRGDDYEC
jgi:hypothetical protein